MNLNFYAQPDAKARKVFAYLLSGLGDTILTASRVVRVVRPVVQPLLLFLHFS